MKKLNGIKSFSSLENKKLTDLSAIDGGRHIGASIVYSNFLNEEGRQDIDTYDQDGKFRGRIWDNISPGC
ncbi:TIGR04139 family peptide modification target [Pedobacter petrophilus]|uniref:TIGR04139 family peptide modification target n=1 Tax=Pedobacter petrophilus TaxID=1908241 RepID=A0A7K0G562_9SPHI|nr:TIGR04139 family peptide modification target [Pedobacter petrophilus]MRX78369.1 TIGR04139 family peptide modification target [Pedobacter petrophilus]